MHAVLQNRLYSIAELMVPILQKGNPVLAYQNLCGQHVAHGFGLYSHQTIDIGKSD